MRSGSQLVQAFGVCLLVWGLQATPSVAQRPNPEAQPLPAPADSVKLTGQVYDIDSLAAQGLRVQVNDTVLFTNSQGEWTVSLPRTKRYKLSILDARTEYYFRIEVDSGTDRIVFPVAYLQPVQVSSLEIVAHRDRATPNLNRATISAQVVRPQDLQRFATTDPIAGLTQVPGVTVKDGQPSIRGSSGYTYGAGTRVITCLNGLPLLTGDRSSAPFELLPIDNIERIEVLKGASSVVYGAGAMGGVFNIVTQVPDTPTTTLRAGLTVYDQPAISEADWDGPASAIGRFVNLSHAEQVGRWGMTLLAGLEHDAGFQEGVHTKTARVLMTNRFGFEVDFLGFRELIVGLDGQVHLDSSGILLAWEGYPDGALTPAPDRYSEQYVLKRHLDPSLTLKRPGLTFRYRSRLYGQDQYISTGQNANAQTNQHDVSLEWHPNAAVTLVGGLNLTNSTVTSDSTFGREAFSTQRAAYLQAEWQPTPKWKLQAGVRYQYERIRGDTVTLNSGLDAPQQELTTLNDPIFRAGVNYQLFPGGFVRGSYGQALRSPSVAERYTQTPIAGGLRVSQAPAVQVERGVNYELGYRQLFQAGRWRGFVDMAAFWQSYDNLVEFYIDLARAADASLPLDQRFAFQAQNVEKATVNGLEITFGAEYQAPSGVSLRFAGGWTELTAQDLNGDPAYNGDDSVPSFEQALFLVALGQLPGDALPEDRPQTLKYRSERLVKLSGGISFGQWSFDAMYRYTGPITNMDKAFLTPTFFPGTLAFREDYPDGWHELDLVLGRQFGALGLSFHVLNALNTVYMPVPGQLGPQRNFRVQATYSF